MGSISTSLGPPWEFAFSGWSARSLEGLPGLAFAGEAARFAGELGRLAGELRLGLSAPTAACPKLLLRRELAKLLFTVRALVEAAFPGSVSLSEGISVHAESEGFVAGFHALSPRPTIRGAVLFHPPSAISSGRVLDAPWQGKHHLERWL